MNPTEHREPVHQAATSSVASSTARTASESTQAVGKSDQSMSSRAEASQQSPATYQPSFAARPNHPTTSNSMALPKASPTKVTLGPVAERNIMAMGMAKRPDGAWTCTIPGCQGKGKTFKDPRAHGREFHPWGTLLNVTFSFSRNTHQKGSLKRPGDFGAVDGDAKEEAPQRRRVSGVPKEYECSGRRIVPSYMVERATRTGLPRWFCTAKGCNASKPGHKGFEAPWSHVYLYHEERDRVEEVVNANKALAEHHQAKAALKLNKEKGSMKRVDQLDYGAPRDVAQGSSRIFNGSENYPAAQRDIGHQEDENMVDVEEHYEFDAEMDEDDTAEEGSTGSVSGTGDGYDDDGVEIVPEEEVVLTMRRRVRGSTAMNSLEEKEALATINPPSSHTKPGRDWQSTVSRWLTKM